VIERLRALLSGGVLARLGPLYQIERAGGCFLLAALEVPPGRFEAVAAQVNAHLQVAHNDRRAHRLNMWFVVAADSPQGVAGCLRAIEAETGLRVHSFPKEREFRVGLPASLPGPGGRGPDDAPLDPVDRQLVAATQSGLPLVPRPCEAVGALVGISAREVQERLAAMLERGLIRRIGVVVNHHRLGYTTDGMAVWDVDDARVDALGEQVAGLPGVTHCYQRTRALPAWPYNLFVMLHGRSHDEVERQADAVAGLLGDACRARDILYGTQLLKKTGLRLALP
jgi:DNA-binding Lrp family transcriptional regulator